MDRDIVIERLIAADLHKLHIGQYSRRLLAVVDREFRSFGSMSDDALAQELARRGLDADPLPDPAYYDDDEDENDDEDAVCLTQAMLRGEDDWATSRG